MQYDAIDVQNARVSLAYFRRHIRREWHNRSWTIARRAIRFAVKRARQWKIALGYMEPRKPADVKFVMTHR